MITEKEIFENSYPGFTVNGTHILMTEPDSQFQLDFKSAFMLMAFHRFTVEDVLNEIRYASQQEAIHK